MKAHLFTDGCCEPNPGPGGIGAVLVSDEGRVLDELSKGIGRCTNNVAEYAALIGGLEMALAFGITEVKVHTDSQLVVNQVLGRWRVKQEHLTPSVAAARHLMGRFDSSSIEWINRGSNGYADTLAGQAVAQQKRVSGISEGVEVSDGNR